MKIVWSKNARDQLMGIVHRIARDKPEAARGWAQQVIQTTTRLKRFPRSSRMVPELKRAEMREVIVGSYRIIYKITSQLTILTVFHGAKGLEG